MTSKRSFRSSPSSPRAVRPGKEVFQGAWNLFVFSAVFALLFNAFYADGIELKVRTPKPFHIGGQGNNHTPDPSYAGWKSAPTPKAHAQPTPPAPFDKIPRLSLSGVKSRFDKQACLFLDARSKERYEEGHIPGAIHFSALEMDKFAPLVMPLLTDKNQEIIVYCDGG